MARYDPQVGHWSFWTQAIGNAFPAWHAARKNPIGRTQVLLNAAAIGVEDVHRQILEYRRNAYLETANLFQPGKAFRIAVARRARSSPSDFPRQNLLYNADFSIPGPARLGTALGWDATGTTGTSRRYAANAFTGTGCMRLHAAAGQECFLRQRVPASEGGTSTAPTTVSASLWVLLPYAVSNIGVGTLEVTVENADGSSASATVAIPAGTGGAWRRLSVPVTTSRRVQDVAIEIHLDNDTGAAIEMFADAAQLEFGAVTPWAINPGALPVWLERPSLGPVFVEAVAPAVDRTVGAVTYAEHAHRRIWLTPWAPDWWLRAMPTRVGSIAAYSGSATGTTRNLWGFRADPDTRSRRTSRYVVEDNRIKLVDANTPVDVHESFKLAERWFDNDGFDRYAVWDEEPGGYTVTIEALTIHRDRLWIVVKETWQSVTYRTLKIARTAPSGWVLADPDITNYLEVLADFDMGLNTGTCTSVAFAEGRDDLLLLTIGGSPYSIDVFYDYAFFSEDDLGALLLRHDYQGDTIVLT